MPGDVNGMGATAEFNSPGNLVVDSAGNVYVADANNAQIRKVTPAGTVSTYAGTVTGFVDGDLTVARFGNPAGIAIDAAGNLYVADLGNQAVRRIANAGDASNLQAGAVTTVAGGNDGGGQFGAVGFRDGTGGPDGTALFTNPTSVAIDAHGNLFVADFGNHAIREVLASTGEVITLAGHGTNCDAGDCTPNPGYYDGTLEQAGFVFPSGVAVDPVGNVYVADNGDGNVREVVASMDGGFTGVTTLAGSTFPGPNGELGATYGFVDGPPGTAQFEGAYCVYFNKVNGNLLIGDQGSNAVREVSLAPDSLGTVTTLAGNGHSGIMDGTGGPASSPGVAEFNGPFGLGVNNNGLIYVADYGNDVIRAVTRH
jgi:hypothetical protein